MHPSKTLPTHDTAGWLLYAQDIQKRYGETDVLRGVTMGLQQGTIVGLVGPNGAGKTTLLNIMAGIFPAEAGAIWLDDGWIDFDRQPEKRRLLGLMLGGRTLIEDLRPDEYWDFITAMHGFSTDTLSGHLDELVTRLRLEPHLSKPIKHLSAGTKKKVEFVAAVLHQPRVLLLDEPFEAIDPPAVHELTSVIRDFVREAGASAVISSHVLPYVRPLATEIRLLWNGRLYEQPALLDLLQSEHKDDDLQTWGAVLRSA